jgi:hypothetical protein
MVHFCLRQWSKWISVTEFWTLVNTTPTHHSALGISPFEVLFGQSPRHLGIDNLQLCSVRDLEQWMKEQELLTRLIQQHLQRAQQRMKAQADKNCSVRPFESGDMIYMK